MASMVPSSRRRDDRVLDRVRHVLTAAGFDEAMTISVVAMKATAGVVRVADPALVVEVVQAEEAVPVAEAMIAVRQAAAASADCSWARSPRPCWSTPCAP